MSDDAFNYKYYEYPRGRPRPLAGLTIDVNGNKSRFLCLIDSGADVSFSFKEIGMTLGIDFEKCPTDTGSGIDKDVQAYIHPATIILNEKYKVEVRVLWLNRKMNPDRDFPFIIGRERFFHKFDITFKEDELRFILKPLKKYFS